MQCLCFKSSPFVGLILGCLNERKLGNYDFMTLKIINVDLWAINMEPPGVLRGEMIDIIYCEGFTLLSNKTTWKLGMKIDEREILCSKCVPRCAQIFYLIVFWAQIAEWSCSSYKPHQKLKKICTQVNPKIDFKTKKSFPFANILIFHKNFSISLHKNFSKKNQEKKGKKILLIQPHHPQQHLPLLQVYKKITRVYKMFEIINIYKK